MAVARTARHRWIDEGLQALAAGGPDAVQIESLARALGVSKGGFYGYFADRRALLDEVLDTWESRSTERVIEQVEHEGGDAMGRARRAAELTFSAELRPIDLAVRDWARRDAAVAERLRRVDNVRIAYLRTLLGAGLRRRRGPRGPLPDRLLGGDRRPAHRRRPRGAHAIRRAQGRPAAALHPGEGSPVVLADRGDGSLPSGG